jgi:cystathionine gamma-synthase
VHLLLTPNPLLHPLLQVRSMHNILGGVIDAHASYLLLRGMKTLGLRVEHQNRSAMEIAKRLEAHPKIARVHYPGLPSHPDHEIAVKQMSGFGGVVSFEVGRGRGWGGYRG